MEIYRCEYHHDRTDEYCANCNGVKIESPDGFVPATKCTGYKADTTGQKYTVDIEESVSEPIKTEEVVITATEDKFTPDYVVSEPKDTEIINITSKDNEGITTKITFMSGATISLNNGAVFYKFECTEERVITPNMNVQDEREKLWATINTEIDKQIKDVYDSN